jgi:hypothetical protein
MALGLKYATRKQEKTIMYNKKMEELNYVTSI